MQIASEDLEENYNGVLQKVADFVGVSVEIPEGIANKSIKKQRDKQTEEWRQRFLQDHEKAIQS